MTHVGSYTICCFLNRVSGPSVFFPHAFTFLSARTAGMSTYDPGMPLFSKVFMKHKLHSLYSHWLLTSASNSFHLLGSELTFLVRTEGRKGLYPHLLAFNLAIRLPDTHRSHRSQKQLQKELPRLAATQKCACTVCSSFPP